MRRGLLLLCGMSLVAWPGAAAEIPIAASPGSPTGAVIADACPTFIWGGIGGATSHELVVYRIGTDGKKLEPLLRQSFPGSVHGWTPALDACFARGGRYAWSVRSIGGDGEAAWSDASLFEVAAGPSATEFDQALSVVRAYLDARGEGAQASSGKAQRGALPATASGLTTPGSMSGPAPRAFSGGDSALQVNGSPVVTMASQLFAVVSASGALTLGSHVTSVGTVPPGEYDVTFDRDVSNCAYTATIGEPGSEPAGLIDTARFKSPNTVTVFTQVNDGVPPAFQDRAFNLVVTCAGPPP